MDLNLKNHFDFVIETYMDSTESLLAGYVVESSITDLSSIERVDLKSKGIDTSSHGLEILSTSQDFCKKVSFEFSEGMNINGCQYHSLKFAISFLKSTRPNFVGRSCFNMNDYFKHRNIARDVESYFFVSDLDSAKKKILDFISEIKYFLELDEIKSILTTDKWIEVPQDRSIYF